MPSVRNPSTPAVGSAPVCNGEASVVEQPVPDLASREAIPVNGSRGSVHDRAIVLIGFMGSGKSELSKQLGDALHEDAIDVDSLIQDEVGSTIEAYFEANGEGRFREVEKRLTLEALDRGGVVALGGGAVESQAVQAALASHLTVWCHVDRDDAWARCKGTERPLAQDQDEFFCRYEDRAPLYKKLARVAVPAGYGIDSQSLARWLMEVRDERNLRLVWAASKSGQYPVVMGQGAALKLPEDRRWFLVADETALERHSQLLPSFLMDASPLMTLQGNELEKTGFGCAQRVLETLVQQDASKKDGLVAFGGGVVGDLAGFCAALFHRGMSFVQVPTTLLAQVDSAYGGKTGVNLPVAKHVVGAYHMPSAVLADPQVLGTLPDEELASGFAEVVKTALIAGGDLWETVRTLDDLRGPAVHDVIFDCAWTKIQIVARDEREESGVRAWLNLGHTVGHAIEVATDYREYRHGEAIGLGLLAVLRLSDAPELRDEVRRVLEKQGLTTKLEDWVETDDVLQAMRRDKKRLRDPSAPAGDSKPAFVLLRTPGHPLEGQDVREDEVRLAIEELKAGR